MRQTTVCYVLQASTHPRSVSPCHAQHRHTPVGKCALQKVHAAVGKVLLTDPGYPPAPLPQKPLHPKHAGVKKRNQHNRGRSHAPRPAHTVRTRNATSLTVPSQDVGGGGTKSNTGLIAGCVIAAVVAAVAVAAVIAVLLLRKRKGQQTFKEVSSGDVNNAGQPHAQTARSAERMEQPVLQSAQAVHTKPMRVSSGRNVYDNRMLAPPNEQASMDSTLDVHSTMASKSTGGPRNAAVWSDDVNAAESPMPTHPHTFVASPQTASASPAQAQLRPSVPQLQMTLSLTATQLPSAQLVHDAAGQERVVPKPAGTFLPSQSAPFTTEQPRTLMESDMRSKLSTALHNMAEQEPPMLFAGRFQLLAEQCQGGQAVVQFARDMLGSLKQFAIKCACLLDTHACQSQCQCLNAHFVLYLQNASSIA